MKRNKKPVGRPVVFIVLALILALTYTAFFGIGNYYGDTKKTYIKGADDIRWGIDIQGGVEAVFSPVVDNPDSITESQMDEAQSIIETRLVLNNITDYEVYTDYSNHQVIVSFPWQSDEKDYDPTEAVKELGDMATLTFNTGDQNSKGDEILSSKNGDIVKATAKTTTDKDSGTTDYQVALELSATGATKFESATAANIGKTIGIWMDENCVSAPTVEDTITGGNAVITKLESYESAKDLANKINSGNLPFALSVDSDNAMLQVISPTLGEQALNVMLIAGAIAFAIICILMILKYRLPGVIACFVLLGQVGGMIACISGYFNGTSSFTLTIPGIAGIILSIGFGVDANVIINERIREELANGKTLTGAINQGFSNAWSAIIDGNLTNVIVALVLIGAFGSPDSILAKILSPILGWFSSSVTGSIYSFGYTLIVGVILNLVMGVLAARFMLKSVSSFKCFKNPRLYGGEKKDA